MNNQPVNLVTELLGKQTTMTSPPELEGLSGIIRSVYLDYDRNHECEVKYTVEVHDRLHNVFSHQFRMKA